MQMGSQTGKHTVSCTSRSTSGRDQQFGYVQKSRTSVSYEEDITDKAIRRIGSTCTKS